MSRALSALSIYRVLFSLAYNQERVAHRLDYNVKLAYNQERVAHRLDYNVTSLFSRRTLTFDAEFCTYGRQAN